MTELQLYKFITENSVEWYRRDNDGTTDVVVLPDMSIMQDFCSLVGGNILEKGIDCKLKCGYFAIWMNDICNYFDIDPDNVFFEKNH